MAERATAAVATDFVEGIVDDLDFSRFGIHAYRACSFMLATRVPQPALFYSISHNDQNAAAAALPVRPRLPGTDRESPMAKVSLQSPINMNAEELWKLIGKFNALPDWHPAVVSSKLEDGGRIRRLSLVGGGDIVERLEQIEQGDRLYRYSIVSGPLPVANYTATLRVKDDGRGGSIVEWSGEFDPSGATETDATQAIQDVYKMGLDSLRKMFGA